MSESPVVTVLGAGSWGSALAIQLSRNGVSTHLWGRDASQMERMERERRNAVYLPGVTFPEHLHATADLAESVTSGSAILIAVPSQAFRATLRQISPFLKNEKPLAWATKGLEPGTAKLLHQVIAEELGSTYPTAVISGPTFAAEVARGLPTAVTVASSNTEV